MSATVQNLRVGKDGRGLRAGGLGIRQRLSALVVVLGLLAAICIGIAVSGLLTARGNARASQMTFSAAQVERNAYEGWLVTDDQSNAYVAVASLRDPTGKMPGITPAQTQAQFRQVLWQQAEQGHQQAQVALRSLVRSAPQAAVRRQAANALHALAGYNYFTNELHDKALAGDVTAAVYVATVSNAAVSNSLQSDFNAMGAELSDHASTITKSTTQSIGSAITLALLIAGLSLALAALVTWRIIRSITRPLAKVARAADKVAQGRVDVELDVHGRDEISKVADSFRAVIAHLKGMSDAAREFAGGYIAVPVQPKSDGDELGLAFNEMQDRMGAALGDHASTTKLDAGLTELLGTLQSLQQGLSSLTAGDLTIAVESNLQPIAPDVEGEQIGFVAERYNEMIASAQASLDGYNQMRDTLREKLGDQSSLAALTDRLESLTNECLADLVGGLQAMNHGDLTIAIESRTEPLAARDGDEIGHLAEVFNVMLENTKSAIRSYDEMRLRISGMLTEISDSSDALTAASTQMASSSDETGRAIAEIAQAVGTVAQGAEQQVREVEIARRITDQLAQASGLSAEAADETALAADQTRTRARDGVAAAEAASAAMRAVRDSSQGASEAIRSLGQKSDEIGGIVQTITGIASQTNLLALNAAIEAARAGEHGRGFAVVAEEVRHLAEESQQAAESIGSLVEEIQSETAKAVEVVELGADQTRGGVETVEQARDAFLQIGQSIEDMSSRVEEIASAIRQTTESSNEMRESMNSVSAVAEASSASTQQVSASTEQTSASTQQIAASAQQLSAMADDLEKLVNQFVLA
jgi:methyl-accepting chemotaxis protein